MAVEASSRSSITGTGGETGGDAIGDTADIAASTAGSTTTAITEIVDSGGVGDVDTSAEPDAGPDEVAGTDPETEFQSYMAARWPVLVRTAYLLTGDQHLAEDLAQVALTRVYAYWHRIRKVDDIDAYVRRVLVNANAGRFRKRRVGEWLTGLRPVRDGDRGADGVGRGGVGLGGADGGALEARSVLMAALAGLTVRQRQVVVLRYWEDLSEKEVAGLLGIAQGTVKSQASKAIARLRGDPGLLAEYGPGAGPLSAIRVEGTDA